MLTAYQTRTQQLLQNPGAPVTLYPLGDINQYINVARGQLAGEGECVRYLASIQTTIGQRNYNFSALDTGVAATTGISGVIHVNSIRYVVGDGYQRLQPQQWEWFELYPLNNPVPINGAPENWTQYGQGGSGTGAITGVGAGGLVSGSFYLDPPPDAVYDLVCDCCCYPQALSIDLDIEAIPYLWTDAVPFFAAYYALLSAQTSSRMADAERLFQHYQTFVDRARKAANSSVTRYIYQQATDPTSINKLGVQKAVGQ